MKKKLTIEGMSCEHCVNRIANALNGIKGVTQVDVNLNGGYAVVEMTEDIGDHQLKETVENAGYDLVAIESQ